ncbi:YybH family protein [Algoriphagus limi]|uniref:DUF4440 domain-containing protein n=1 Tax=Algoriphagus limi TaxID=2975273 RepID=A0ABT2GAZ9_9BACT|nr:DUF4440 domain-containing protein [Algoriphagus limi]MCS5491122.1 DUF4440 domain-containing protein [Algoriphagus limi]
MKYFAYFILILFSFSCAQKTEHSEIEISPVPMVDIQAELDAIEETRAAFQLAIKEKRYGDLAQYSTDDFIGVSPGSVEWLEYKREREQKLGMFSYDSIRMRPQETVIVSDSVAYDFGTSSVFYTNSEGESVELFDTFLVILKKDKKDGIWKIHREVASAIIE